MEPEVPRKDYYGILRLPHGSSEALVRQRFKRLAKRLHPDVNRAPDAAERFREIREAHDVLTDPAQRTVVDSWYAPRGGRTRRRSAREGAAPPFSSTGPRPLSPVWTSGSDRAWSFGCFALVAFVVVLLGSLSQQGDLARAVGIALGVALVVGLLAALGGERVREWLLWLLWWS